MPLLPFTSISLMMRCHHASRGIEGTIAFHDLLLHTRASCDPQLDISHTRPPAASAEITSYWLPNFAPVTSNLKHRAAPPRRGPEGGTEEGESALGEAYICGSGTLLAACTNRRPPRSDPALQRGEVRRSTERA